jgi:dipeptidyl-peptidase 4
MRLFCSILLTLALSIASAQQPINLEDIWQKDTLNAKTVPGFNFRNDGVHYTRLESGRIIEYDLRSGQATQTLLDVSTLKTDAAGWKNTFDAYQFSDNEQYILLSTETEPIYRWSKAAHYFMYNQSTGKLTRLHEKDKQRYPTFSPDGSRVAFVCENDLYIFDLKTEKKTRITTDGRFNAIINGASDWVYEEEFELIRAFEWSHDGKKIAFFRFDESEVPEMSMDIYGGEAYPNTQSFKYPKVGEPNALVTAHVYSLAADQITNIELPNRNVVNGRFDDYLPRLKWTPTGQVCITWMNRHQNLLRLWTANPKTGKCQLLYEEQNKYYLDLNDVTFLADGAGFIVQSEKSGFNHLYYYDMKGREIVAITKGEWEVTNFYGVDEKNETVYYQAAKVNPMQRELYCVGLNGKKDKQIGTEKGTNSAQFSGTFDYFVHTFSTMNSPPTYTVCDRKGKQLRMLEQNQALREKMGIHKTIPAEFFEVKSEDHLMLNAWMIRPTAPHFQNQKLPLLMFVYGGPGSQKVLDEWKDGNYWWFQMLAQQGYVVACVDNRGTGGRGEAFQKITYRQLGHYETIDQVESAKVLGKLPFIDSTRVGIFGWSYGGYMSSLALFKGGKVFNSAIAVAPVTNWKWYDAVYTERYMQTHAENKAGYEDNSPINFVDKLKGNYLLIHGLADDNVHFQHSAELNNQLILKNKQFDSMYYPNRNHGISGGNTRLHLYTQMTKFLEENLKKEINPKP